MSRLNDLLRQLEAKDASLAKDLRREVDALSNRRAFGSNFERHVPEAVELPGRPVRRGDKVRVLPPRGSSANEADSRIWRVLAISKDAAEARTASLELVPDGAETSEAVVEDLVVVAEFRDPIYPGLVSTGRVERGGDKPYHAVINAENYHALQTLLFTHRSKVDVIYIDPPYNTGARDWKYNNDYVETDDIYRHSKWLALMERRLRLAAELFNPDASVLIVSIDEREFLRLGLLLEQLFPAAKIQMVTTVIKPEGTGRRNEFGRTNEFIFFVMIGNYRLVPTSDAMVDTEAPQEDLGPDDAALIDWRNLRRRERESIRGSRPNQFYAIFIDKATGLIHSVGDALDDSVARTTIHLPEGCIAEFPLNGSGGEMLWSVTPDRMRFLVSKGYARFNGRIVQYLSSGTVDAIDRGDITITGTDQYGGIIGAYSSGSRTVMPRTLWVKASHNAQASGSLLLKSLVGDRSFPFPKSLYAVEDCLRFFVAENPNALIVDFFAGSGTTTHAAMRLNHQDGGRRRSISITNNEVNDRASEMLTAGLRPGDPDWEAFGICEYITKPRITAAVTGVTASGEPIAGDYRFTDQFPMSAGFEENIEFFTLTYEAPLRVSSDREFGRIAALLWLRAGSEGRRIESMSTGWDVADKYGVLADLNQSEVFVRAIAANSGVRIAFIITDEDRLFEAVVRELPDHVEPTRMYEAYLQNFEIETMRSAL